MNIDWLEESGAVSMAECPNCGRTATAYCGLVECQSCGYRDRRLEAGEELEADSHTLA